MQHLHDSFGVVLVGFEKHPHGKTQFLPALPEVACPRPMTASLSSPKRPRHSNLSKPCNSWSYRNWMSGSAPTRCKTSVAAELMLAPESKLIGKRLGDAEFRSRHRVSVLAIRHRGDAADDEFGQSDAGLWRHALVAGDWADIGKLWDDRENFALLTLPAEYQERLPARHRAPARHRHSDRHGCGDGVRAHSEFRRGACSRALAMIAGGCVKLDAIYRIISWKTVVLIAGMLPLATALTKTGATELMAKELVATLGALGPTAMLAVVFLVTALVGLFVSNSATAVLIGPVAIEAAQTLHVSPYAFAMTVSIACCAAYVTPVSSPGEYAGDGTWRLRLRRLCQGRSAAAVADNACYRCAGRGDLSPLGH